MTLNIATALAVSSGGTGLVSGTSGGILAFTGEQTLSSSGVLTQNALVLGGGIGVAPSTPVSLGSTTTVLHGNVSGDPSWGAVNLTADVSNVLPVGHGGTGVATLTSHGVVLGNTTGAVNVTAAGASHTVLHGNTSADPTYSAVDLTADVINVLPVGHGGTGNTTGAATTNANLTGPITSVGNATAIASQTGTGSKFVVDTSPTLVTPNIGVAAATSVNFGVTALSYYGEAAWTPANPQVTLTVGSASYTRIGRCVFVECEVTLPVNVDGTAATITGLPFTVGTGNFATYIFTNSGTAIQATFGTGGTVINNIQNPSGPAALTNAQLSGATLRVSGFYFV